MQIRARLVILLGITLFYFKYAESVTKYACVSFSGIGSPRAPYGGVMGPNWEFDLFGDSNSNSVSSEEFFGFGGYDPRATRYGMIPGFGGPAPNMSPGTSPLAAGAFSPPYTGAAAAGLPNTAASLGGASHITGQSPQAIGPPGHMPYPPRPPGNPGMVLTGRLTCADRPGSTILITKLVYGNGGIYTCSAPDQDCDIVDYQDTEITPFCDGRVNCNIRTTGKLLPSCKATSNFVHVEYECIFPRSSFNICKDTETVVRELEVYIMSPSFFQAATPPSKKCECILKSRYDNRIMAQYVHTDLHESGNLTCTDSSVLFESKLNPNQTELEKRTEVCGRRSLNNYLYRGDLRITFRDSDSGGSRGGFVSKLLVPPIGMGMQNEIAIQCGPVRNAGDPTPAPNSMNNNPMGMPFPGSFGPYSPLGTLNSPFQQSPRIPAPPVFEGVNSMQPPNVGMPFPGMGPPQANWGGQTNWGNPQFQAPKFSFGPPGGGTTSTAAPPAWARNEKPPIPIASNIGPPPLMTATRRRPPTRQRIQSKDVTVETKDGGVDNTGRLVAYVIGGIGAVMTAFGALFISLYCTRRKQRVLERRASEKSDTEIENQSSSAEDIPVYNDPSASDLVHPIERANCGHVNSAFDETEAAAGDRISVISGSFEDIRLHDDGNYLSLDEVAEERRRGSGDDVPLEMMVESKYCKSLEVVRRPGDFEESVYDNNI